MKLKYPAEAFALGIVLFSAGMKEAFAAGILVIAAVVFAEFLKNLLEPFVPLWSVRLSVLIGTGSICASAFLLGFSQLGIEVNNGLWIMTFIVGLLAAKHVLMTEIDAEYGELFWESGIAWGFWVLLAAVREFCAGGSIFGNTIFEASFQSKSFLETTFAFLTAGLVLAFTNGVLKKRSRNTHSLLLVIPMVIFSRPFAMESFGELVGMIWTIAVPVVMFISAKKTLKFARTGLAYRGLPCEMLAMGFIYMILSIY
ncbi:MAG: hypothetical protein KHY79_05180 [Clostridiales bacterium]|nr:hypothetical protein [Clostridiales bacterium]